LFLPPSLSLTPSLARDRPRAGPALRPPPPRLELTVRLHEPLEHLHDQGPHVDRLAGGLAVIDRVGRQRGVKLARYPSLECGRRVGLDRLQLHRRTVSSYGPGNTRSWVSITWKA